MVRYLSSLPADPGIKTQKGGLWIPISNEFPLLSQEHPEFKDCFYIDEERRGFSWNERVFLKAR